MRTLVRSQSPACLPKAKAIDPVSSSQGSNSPENHDEQKSAADGGSPHKGHHVEAHDSAPLIMINDGLEDRVAGRHLDHESGTSDEEEDHGEPDHPGEGEADDADSEDRHCAWDDRSQTEYAAASGQPGRPQERSRTR